MSLELLLVLVVGGISAIVLILHLLGRSKTLVMTEETARAGWLRQFPDSDIADVTLAHDGKAALIRTTDDAGLVWSFGADSVARVLHDYDLQDHSKTMRFLLHDFSAPSVTVHLNDTERQDWHSKLEAL